MFEGPLNWDSIYEKPFIRLIIHHILQNVFVFIFVDEKRNELK